MGHPPRASTKGVESAGLARTGDAGSSMLSHRHYFARRMPPPGLAAGAAGAAGAGSWGWQRGLAAGAGGRAVIGMGLGEARAAAGPGDRVADAGTGDGIGQVQGIAGGQAVDAVGIEEVPVLIAGIAVGEEDVEVRVRAPRTALASRSGVARPAEDLAGRDVLAEQVEVDRLGVGTPVTDVEAAAGGVLGAAGGQEVGAVGGQPLGAGRRVGEGLGPGGVAVVPGA